MGFVAKNTSKEWRWSEGTQRKNTTTLPPLAFIKIWIIYHLICRWLLTFSAAIPSPLRHPFAACRSVPVCLESQGLSLHENYWPWSRASSRNPRGPTRISTLSFNLNSSFNPALKSFQHIFLSFLTFIGSTKRCALKRNKGADIKASVWSEHFERRLKHNVEE